MAEKAPDTRLYVIVNSENKEPVALIDCANQAQAARHFVAKRFDVRYAEQADVFAAAKAGIEVEKPGEADA